MKHFVPSVGLALLFACAKQSAAPASETPNAVAPESGAPEETPAALPPAPIETANEDATTGTPKPTPEQIARVEAIRDRVLAVLTRDPRSQKIIQRAMEGVTDPAEARERGRALGSVLASRGIARLSDAMLERWLAVRAKMNHASLEVCAAEGPVNRDALTFAMASLDDQMVEDFVHVTTEATLAELSATTPLVQDPKGLALGIDALQEQLTPEDRERFAAVMAGTRTTASDMCFGSHVMHDVAPRLEPELRARYIRALAAAMASP